MKFVVIGTNKDGERFKMTAPLLAEQATAWISLAAAAHPDLKLTLERLGPANYQAYPFFREY